MKRILVVINTLGRAGAERALIEFLRQFDPNRFMISLYVLTGQGEMIHEIPAYVTLLNRRYDDSPVYGRAGKRRLKRKIFLALFCHGAFVKNIPYLCLNMYAMLKEKRVLPDKLLWRVLSDGGLRQKQRYDLAVAFLEGGSAYYVADHVRAEKKAAFFHVDYRKAGYTRRLDRDCYLAYDKIFPVSDSVKDSFLNVYPECADRTEVFPNILERKKIRELSEVPGGFGDAYDGFRILSVGRLTAQKSWEVSVGAMKLLKDAKVRARWYVLGEGDERGYLEKRIKMLGLEEDFLLPGAVENPYPYMKQADIYVHASRFEGKSIAVQEAQILGKAILASESSSEQIENDVDGILCAFTTESICRKATELLRDGKKRERLGKAAALKSQSVHQAMDKLFELL